MEPFEIKKLINLVKIVMQFEDQYPVATKQYETFLRNVQALTGFRPILSFPIPKNPDGSFDFYGNEVYIIGEPRERRHRVNGVDVRAVSDVFLVGGYDAGEVPVRPSQGYWEIWGDLYDNQGHKI